MLPNPVAIVHQAIPLTNERGQGGHFGMHIVPEYTENLRAAFETIQMKPNGRIFHI